MTIQEIKRALSSPCDEATFAAMRCPVCGAELFLAVNPEFNDYFVCCKASQEHPGTHGESEERPEWWNKYVTSGWY
jgi:hypothetical protein